MARPASKDPSATMGFSLTISLVQWVSEQAEKRGITKSHVVREAVAAAKQAEADSQKVAA